MRKSIYAAVTLLIGAASCQIVETPDPSSRLAISISADPVYEDDGAPETKAVIHGTKMYWTPGDTLGVFPGNGSQVYFIVDTEGEALSAPFDGGDWEFKTGSVYRSYYPLVGQFYLNPAKIPVQYYKERNGEIELQTQTGNDSSLHTSEYLYMYTDPQQVEDGRISFIYHHLWTVLKPSVTLPAGHYTKLTFTLDDPLFVVKGYFNLTSDAPAIIGTEYANEVSMDLDVTLENSEIPLTAYYATAPLDMRGKTLTITVTEESGAEYSYDYSPSKAYVAGVTYKLTSAVSFANRAIYYTSSDGEVVTPNATDVFGANITSNTYKNGQGVITFNGDVTSVGDNAFKRCTNLASIVIPESLTNIGSDAFYGCTNLASIVIPESVTSIGSGAFYGCKKLSSIVIPEGVTNIESSTFNRCSSLASICLPESVISIGELAFCACTSLTSINIPESVISIGDSAFSNSTGLISIVIPESVTSIGDNAFEYCTNLTSIVIPGGITCIGNEMFYSCWRLSSIDIPDGVTRIDYKAFYDCSSLTSIEIPESVTSIGGVAFYLCNSLTSIVCHRETPPTGGEHMFENATNDFPIYVPAGSVDAYKTAQYWSDYANRIQAIPSSVPEAIDLGLPSGTKWASFNLGATAPEEFGDYYAWGETVSKESYSWNNYKWWWSGHAYSVTKYNTKSEYGPVDNTINLDYEDDVANYLLGGDWRIPSKEEMQELIDNCTWEYYEFNGVSGLRITSEVHNYTDRWIFLPFAGYWADSFSGYYSVFGYFGDYWTSRIGERYPCNAYFLNIGLGNNDSPYPGEVLNSISDRERYYGHSIRPVKD